MSLMKSQISTCLLLILLLYFSPAKAQAPDEVRNAEKLLDENKFVEAEKAFDILAERYPGGWDAFYGRGRARWFLQNYSGAESDLNRAIQLNAKDSNCFNARGVTYWKEGKISLALADLQKAIDLQPANTRAYANRAVVYSELDEKDKAIADVVRLVELDAREAPSNISSIQNRVSRQQGLLLASAGWLQTGEYKTAIALTDELLKLDPRESRAHLIRSQAMFATGDKKDAAKEILCYSFTGPQVKHPVAVPKELVLNEDSALKNAIKTCTQANVDLLSAARHERACYILSEWGENGKPADLEEAVAYELSAAQLSRRSDYYYVAGLIFEELSKTDKRAQPMAELMLWKSVDRDPENAIAWLELGLLMAERDRRLEAIHALEMALTQNPSRTAFYAVGPLCALYAIGDEGTRGVEFFQDLYEANPELADLGTGLALMLYCTGSRDKAISQVQDLLLFESIDSPQNKYLKSLLSDWTSPKEKR